MPKAGAHMEVEFRDSTTHHMSRGEVLHGVAPVIEDFSFPSSIAKPLILHRYPNTGQSCLSHPVLHCYRCDSSKVFLAEQCTPHKFGVGFWYMMEESFWRWNSDERVYECVEMSTGHILKVATVPGDHVDPNKALAAYVQRTINGKEVLVHTSIIDYRGRASFTYSDALASVICTHIIEGKTVDEISAIPNMPDKALIRKWRRLHPRFDEAFIEAEKMRAEAFHDEVIKLGRDATNLSKDEVPGQKLATETLKWAAKVGDPTKYGDKLKVEASVASEIIVATGVPRKPINDAIDVTPVTAKSDLPDSSTLMGHAGEAAGKRAVEIFESAVLGHPNEDDLAATDTPPTGEDSE